MEQYPSQSSTESVNTILSILKKEYVVVGTTRVRSWHAWLIIGVAVGIIAGILLVASRSGEFEAGDAANPTLWKTR